MPELGWGWGCPLLPRLPLKTYYLQWGAWAESLSNTCLDRTLHLGMKWIAVGPTVFYLAGVLRGKTQDFLPVLPWGEHGGVGCWKWLGT